MGRTDGGYLRHVLYDPPNHHHQQTGSQTAGGAISNSSAVDRPQLEMHANGRTEVVGNSPNLTVSVPARRSSGTWGMVNHRFERCGLDIRSSS